MLTQHGYESYATRLLAHSEFLVRACLSLGLGSCIGLERQLRRHEAGLKTNALVAVGSSLFATMSLHFQEPDRIIAQIVTGVGFLGAGMIMRDGQHVRGLNTAATMWCSASIGTLAGLGDYWTSVEAAALVVIANIVLRYVADRVEQFQARQDGQNGTAGQ